MKTMVVTAIAVSIMMATFAAAQPQDAGKVDAKPKKEQTTCPVMGGKINKSVYVDVEGKRIYLCCKGCEGAIKKEPAKYIKKLEAAGVTVEDAPSDPKDAKSAPAAE